jgi:hypothetical protein
MQLTGKSVFWSPCGLDINTLKKNRWVISFLHSASLFLAMDLTLKLPWAGSEKFLPGIYMGNPN